MNLQAISISNFLSMKTANIPLSNQGLTLIDGINLDNPSLDNNGAGKSTVIEAVVYALFGRTLRGARGDAVVNSVTGKDCSVALMLTDDNGDKYVIVRNRKHKRHKNAPLLLFTPNGAPQSTDITPKSEKDFDAEVERIIGMDYTTFVSSVVYSDSSFRFTSATDSELKAIFEKMLGIGVWADALAETKRRIVAMNNERAQIINERSVAESSVRQYEALLHGHRENEKSFKAQEAERLKRLKSLFMEQREAANSLREKMEVAKNGLNLLTADMDVKMAMMERAKENHRQIAADTEQWRQDYSQYERETMTLTEMSFDRDKAGFDARSAERNMASVSAELSALDEELKKAETESMLCPHCGQELTPEHKEKVIAEIKARIASREETLKTVTDAHDEIVRKESDLTRKAEKLKSELEAKKTELDRRKTELDASETHAAYLKAQEAYSKAYDAVVHAKGEADSAQNAFHEARKQAAETEREIEAGERVSPYGHMISDTEAKIVHFKERAKEMARKTAEYDTTLESLRFWETAFGNSGIKSFILDSVTPFLTERANFYLSKLAGSRISVEFETQTALKSGEKREKFSINVRNLDGGGVYALNSGGEKKRVDLAIYFALQDLVASRANKKFNVVFCDEAFDALDESGMESVMSLLRDISEEKSSVFVVTHSSALKNSFSNAITIRKSDGLSIALGA